jgi:hypothetical protein
MFYWLLRKFFNFIYKAPPKKRVLILPPVEKPLLNVNDKTSDTSYVLTFLPLLGNVLMTYNNNTDTFHYYSDRTIPYRQLEVVAKRFACFSQCGRIYNDQNRYLHQGKIANFNFLQSEKYKMKKKASYKSFKSAVSF